MSKKSLKIGVVMDPIGHIFPKKDSTLAMMLEAQARGYTLSYMELGDLYVVDGQPRATASGLTVRDDPNDWYELGESADIALKTLDVILMRKDPPFDMEYVYATYTLELAEREGTLVVNQSASLRDVNEKAFIQWFPDCCPPTLVTRQYGQIQDFLAEHKKIVVKPLDGMGGKSIFLLTQGDLNLNVILETVTQDQTRQVMAQRYIPEIAAGDKRILLIDGEPVPYALARIPKSGELRGNLAVGGRGEGIELSTRDRWLADQVGPVMREKGLLFVGIDVIGDYLTEVNVTSPTCIRELDAIFNLNISALLFDAIEARLRHD
ncbi:MAG: glutathione synthase [Gammaproteobacteria bacterium]|nr:glutathione synthase [Gammaproteobacteria bacterium]